MVYASPGDADFISYVKGSMSIPVAMPPEISAKQEVLFDGGTRDVAPLGKAINDGADDIIGIVCQAMQLAPDTAFKPGNLMQLTGRLEDIIVNQNVQNDSEWIQFINAVITEARAKKVSLDTLKTYDLVKHLIIQPNVDLSIDISAFTTTDIQTNFNLGYETAKAALAGGCGLSI